MSLLSPLIWARVFAALPLVVTSLNVDLASRETSTPMVAQGVGMNGATGAIDGTPVSGTSTPTSFSFTCPAGLEAGMHRLDLTSASGTTTGTLWFEVWSVYDQTLSALWTDYDITKTGWFGQASAGTSGATHDINIALGSFPSAGASLNGHVGALCNGAQGFVDPGFFQGSYFGQDPWISASGTLVLQATGTPVADPGSQQRYKAAGIFSNPGGTFGIGIHAAGITLFGFDQATYGEATASFSFGATHVVQWEVTERLLRIRVDGGAWATAAWNANTAQPALEGRDMRVCANYNNSANFVGTIWHVHVTTPIGNSAIYAKELAAVQQRYGLAGLYSAAAPKLDASNGSVAIGDTLQVFGRGCANATSMSVNGALAPITSNDATSVSCALPSGLGSYVVPAFNGTTKLGAPGASSAYQSAAAYGGWALINSDAITAAGASGYDGHAVLGTITNGFWTLFLRVTNGQSTVGIRHYQAATGTAVIVETPIAVGAWTLVQWSYNGTTLKIRVDGGAWASVAATALDPSGLAQALSFGATGYSVNFIGRMAEVGLIAADITDANHDNVIASMNTEYGLGLGGVLGTAFSRATLAIAGWWRRASYVVGTWTATASAGASSGRNATEATVPAAVGALTSFGVSVTTPAGVSNVVPFECFAPSAIATPILWLRADLGVTAAANANVTGWNDQSGAGDANRNFGVGTTIDRVKLTARDPGYNGKATIGPFHQNLGSNDTRLETSGAWSATFSSATNPITDILVGHTSRSSVAAYWTYKSATDYQGVVTQASSYVIGYTGDATTSNLYESTDSFTLPAGGVSRSRFPAVAVLVEFTKNANGSISVDNVETAAGTGYLTTTTIFGDAKMYIGAYGGSTGALTYGIQKIAERITYGRKLTTSEKARVSRYLGNRYGRFYGASETGNRQLEAFQLNLKVWLRDFDGSATWDGERSRGKSGDSYHGFGGGVAPTYSGFELDGSRLATFNGTTQYLQLTSTYAPVSTTRWFLSALVRPNSIVADPGAGSRYASTPIAGDSGTYWGVGLTTTGAVAFAYDTASKELKTANAPDLGAWNYVACWMEGQVLYLQLNGGPIASTPMTGPMGSLGNTLLGRMYAGSPVYFQGEMAEVMITDARISGRRRELYRYTQRTYPRAGLLAMFDEPALTFLSKPIVTTAGDASVTVNGQVLAGCTLTVGGTPVTVSSTSAASITFAMPAKAAGSYDLVATTPSGVRTNIVTILVENSALVWFDADHATVAGGVVPAMPNLAPGGLALALTTSGSAQPRYSSRKLGGSAAIVHDGVDDQLVSSMLATPSNGPFTFYFVAQWDAFGTLFLLDDVDSSARIALFDAGSDGSALNIYVAGYQAGAGILHPSQPHVFCAILWSSIDVYIDDATAAVGGAALGATAILKSMRIGARFNSASLFNGAWGMMSVFTGVHGLVLRTRIMNILRSRYRTP